MLEFPEIRGLRVFSTVCTNNISLTYRVIGNSVDAELNRAKSEKSTSEVAG